jgi:hypothetical protein
MPIYKGDHAAHISATLREDRRRVLGTTTPVLGTTTPSSTRSPRRFFCRTCGRAQNGGARVPDGWYSLERHKDRVVIRLGLYCSTRCFVAMVPRLEGIGRAVEAGTVDPPGYGRR